MRLDRGLKQFQRVHRITKSTPRPSEIRVRVKRPSQWTAFLTIQECRFSTLPFNILNHNFVFHKSGGTMVQQATTLIQQGGEYWLELSIGELASNN